MVSTSLSPRQVQIAVLVKDGKSNKEIADELSIGSETVKSHMAKIFRALNIGTRAELAVWASQNLGG